MNDRSGVIWWYKRHNELQSVWFLASKTFLYGVNLAGKAITEHLNEGKEDFFVKQFYFQIKTKSLIHMQTPSTSRKMLGTN